MHVQFSSVYIVTKNLLLARDHGLIISFIHVTEQQPRLSYRVPFCSYQVIAIV